MGGPTGGSSEEYWSMGGSLNQPSRVRDEGPMGRKPLLRGGNVPDASGSESTARISIG